MTDCTVAHVTGETPASPAGGLACKAGGLWGASSDPPETAAGGPRAVSHSLTGNRITLSASTTPEGQATQVTFCYITTSYLR